MDFLATVLENKRPRSMNRINRGVYRPPGIVHPPAGPVQVSWAAATGPSLAFMQFFSARTVKSVLATHAILSVGVYFPNAPSDPDFPENDVQIQITAVANAIALPVLQASAQLVDDDFTIVGSVPSPELAQFDLTPEPTVGQWPAGIGMCSVEFDIEAALVATNTIVISAGGPNFAIEIIGTVL